MYSFQNPLRKFFAAFGRSLPPGKYRKRYWTVQGGWSSGLSGEIKSWVRSVVNEIRKRKNINEPDTQSYNRRRKSKHRATLKKAANQQIPSVRYKFLRSIQLTIICHDSFGQEMIDLAKTLKILGIPTYFLGICSTMESQFSLKNRSTNSAKYVYHAARMFRPFRSDTSHALEVSGVWRRLTGQSLQTVLNTTTSVAEQGPLQSNLTRACVQSFRLLGLQMAQVVRTSGVDIDRGRIDYRILYSWSHLNQVYESLFILARAKGVPIQGRGIVFYQRRASNKFFSSVQPSIRHVAEVGRETIVKKTDREFYHDYFDKSGSIIGRDDRGFEIRIVDTDSIESVNGLTWEEKLDVYHKNSRLPSAVTYANESSPGKFGKEILEGIINHYRWRVTNCPDPVAVAKVNSPSAFGIGPRPGTGYTFLKEADYGLSANSIVYSKTPVLGIGISGQGRIVNEQVKVDINNKYNLMNIIVHEVGHFNRIIETGKNYVSIPQEDSEEGIINHLEVYLEGVKHWTYKESDEAHKEQTVETIRSYIKQLDSKDAQSAWNTQFSNYVAM